ncbi:MAG: ribonuclease D [Alphaproteobacteria bacterium]
MNLITDTASLSEFCARVEKSGFITVDTEFIRDKTYWPKLCLIQVAGENDVAAIDAVAEGIDLAPVLALMNAEKPLKVFHAARQDFEIFYNLSGAVPTPVFDSQVAAMVCGFGDSVGYETLVNKLARARIDKTMRFTDWERRPLSDKQLDYALADVTHLRVIYEKLRAQIEESGREGWLSEEMAGLCNPEIYQFDVRKAWQRLKARSTRPRFLAILRELAAWRETEAQTRDVPRNRIMRDDALFDIAAHAPSSKSELTGLRGVRGDQVSGARGEAILAAIATGQAVPKDECPEAVHGRGQMQKNGAAVELLKVLLKLKCESHDVAQKVLASSSDIEAIAGDDNADVPALHGWRREIFGEDALALKSGKLAITADGSRLKVIRVGD